jgi:radical SAM protein with 4Fe4S-binding SPASM domain
MSKTSKFDFSDAEIDSAAAEGRLLSMEIEFSRACNYRCPYCYVPDAAVPPDELTPDEIRSALRQASELGAKKIVVLGGEPFLFPQLFEMLDQIGSLGMMAEVFTNGSLISPENAERLFRAGVRVSIKLNSLDPDIHDELTGEKDSLYTALRAIAILKDAGYCEGEDDMLAAGSIISSRNIEGMASLWRWLREERITPLFEIITPQGRALDNRHLMVEGRRLQRVFSELAAIDADFGRQWNPQPPLVGRKCLRHSYSCLVNSVGAVMPCVGLTVVIGNIRSQRLKEILAGSGIISKLKNFRRNIKKPCADCDKAEHCYGCRGAAYQMTGDYLAADPTCWFNAGKLDQIKALPLDAASFIPHRPPISMVGRIVKVGDNAGDCESLVMPDNIFLDENGILSRSALIEAASQSAAAVNSFMNDGRILPGMLVGVKSFRFFGDARSGDLMIISLKVVAEFAASHNIVVNISVEGRLICKGELKICVFEN